MDVFQAREQQTAWPIYVIKTQDFNQWQTQQPQHWQHSMMDGDFHGKDGQWLAISARDGHREAIVLTVVDTADPWALAGIASALPSGCYRLANPWPDNHQRALLGWGLAQYRFQRYKKNPNNTYCTLLLEDQALVDQLTQQLAAISLYRDLVNTPAQDLLPSQLAAEFVALGESFDAQIQQWVGDELLEQNYPVIHAVGRASADAPRLLDLRWGDQQHPRLTLVGKGVCFDSGGLNIKPGAGMRLMKKDMGGAAQIMALAHMVMAAQLPVRLRVLIPAVENAIAGNALRPGDVVRSRSGLSIEVDNTDAEGRLILADALTEAASEQPDLIIDFATLTGAARVALGLELPALFSNRTQTAQDLLAMGEQERDWLWQLPLHDPYRNTMRNSQVADLINSANKPFGGAILAALFMEEFIPKEQAWVHVDFGGWNDHSRPGRPAGAMEMGLRAFFHYLQKRYGQ